jgi:hypothetical protein
MSIRLQQKAADSSVVEEALEVVRPEDLAARARAYGSLDLTLVRYTGRPVGELVGDHVEMVGREEAIGLLKEKFGVDLLKSLGECVIHVTVPEVWAERWDSEV